MDIKIAVTAEDIAGCYPVMRELRPHIRESEFLSRVRRQEQAGYRLAYLRQGNDIVAVAGFRIAENLAWGHFLYVDDLVTLAGSRSHGFGSALLAWLRDYAARNGCEQLHLDSGMQRTDAHRFYEREGMAKAGFHFAAATGGH
jgi:GNAT superfamily N-acetyltransferase